MNVPHNPKPQRDSEVLYVGMQWHVISDGGLVEELLLYNLVLKSQV